MHQVNNLLRWLCLCDGGIYGTGKVSTYLLRSNQFDLEKHLFLHSQWINFFLFMMLHFSLLNVMLREIKIEKTLSFGEKKWEIY